MPGPAKFRLYTRLLLLQGLILIVIIRAILAGQLWPAVSIAVGGLAAIAAVEARPELTAWPSATFRRWAPAAAAATMTLVWLANAIVARLATSESVIAAVRIGGISAAFLAALSLLPFLRRKWWILFVVSVASGVAFEASLGSALLLAGSVLLSGSIIVGTTLLTFWGLRVLAELERAKHVEADLQLAEERLRFARDLHDVVGRGFSAVAVKSELAATLSRAGDADGASTEMDEIKALAVESMGEMRRLVRGYRDIDLQAEVAGARSLLSAAGCRLVVEGDPTKVPAPFHEVAAWVVREGTTNIVRHSSATSAGLSLGTAGMSLRNDGAPGTTRERSGLRGLAERLATVGARLDTVAAGDEFVLEVHWEDA